MVLAAWEKIYMMLLCVSINEIIDGQIYSLSMTFVKNVNFTRVVFSVLLRFSRCKSR